MGDSKIVSKMPHSHKKQILPSIYRRNFDILVMMGILVLLITGTLIRNEIWNSDVDLWQDTVNKSPQKIRPYSNLLGALIMERRYPEALKVGLRALKLPDRPYYLYYNIANAHHHLRNLPEAYKYARKAVDMNKDNVTMHQLGLVLRDMGWKPGMPSPKTLEE